MNISSLTALIITFHNLAAILTLVIALILSLFCYALFLRRLKQKGRAFAIAFVLSLLLAWIISDRIFLKKPMSFELVSVG